MPGGGRDKRKEGKKRRLRKSEGEAERDELGSDGRKC